MTPEITLLVKLLIFALVWYGNAKLIIGFNRAAQEDMILEKVKLWSDKNLGEFWSKPVYACPSCMPSLHGLIPFLITYSFMFDFSLMTFFYWAFYTLSLSGETTYLNER